MLAGMISRPAAISSRTNSGAAFSFSATRFISGVTSPLRAASSCVMRVLLSDLDQRLLRPRIQNADSSGDPFGRLHESPRLDGIRLGDGNGDAAVAAGAHRAVKRDLAQKRDVEFLAEELAARAVKKIDVRMAGRTFESRHIFDEAQ